MKKYFAFLTGFLFFGLHAQQFPPRIQWREIRTGHFRIIYPREIDSLARKTAYFLEHNHRQIGKGLRYKTRLTPVILNSYTAVPNGYAALAPRRTEWYMTPYYGLYFGNRAWYRDLAVHEYRHITQFDAMNSGGIRILRWLAGDMGQIAGMFMTYPMWLFEGDAVYTETVWGPAGRGRTGRFAMPVKAVVHEYPGKDLNYYDFYYQSYKKYYPSHYHLGYYLVSYLHQHPGPFPYESENGESPIGTLIREGAKYAYVLPFGFHDALITERNLNFRQLADSTWADLRKYWSGRIPEHVRPLPDYVRRGREPYAHDIYPHPLPGGGILYLHYGFDTSPAIMIQTAAGSPPEKITGIPAYRFTAGKRYAAWLEYRPHPRWQKQVMTEPVMLDLHTFKIRHSGLRKRYTDLKLSTDGHYLAAVYYDSLLRPHVEIRRTKDMQLLTDRVFRGFYSLHYPVFSPGGHRLLIAALDEERGTGLYLWYWNESESKPVNILPHTRSFQLENPFFTDSLHIGWSDDYNGLNVVEMDLRDGKIKPLTRRRYGATYRPATPCGLPITTPTVSTWWRLLFHNYERDNASAARMITVPNPILRSNPFPTGPKSPNRKPTPDPAGPTAA